MFLLQACFSCIIYHFLSSQFFSIVLIIFIIEVAGAVVLFVFQGLVSGFQKLSWQQLPVVRFRNLMGKKSQKLLKSQKIR